ncbi:MAG: hypothetical protein HC898_08530 [Phycisphaerales bacterium]|nr:hypothetical protein [Phycisphaerales bacterium]
MLRAAGALRDLLLFSEAFRSESLLAAYEPFALSKTKSPVLLGIKAIINRHVYDYNITYNHTEILSENLILYQGDNEPAVLIERNESIVAGDWMRHDLFALLAKDFRKSACYFSWRINLLQD